MFFNLFSVTFAGQTSVKSHAIVSHHGEDNGMGSWTCAKDCGVVCGHITKAWHELQKLVQVDPTAADGAVHDGVIEHVVPGSLHLSFHAIVLTNYQYESAVLRNRPIVPSHTFLSTCHCGLLCLTIL